MKIEFTETRIIGGKYLSNTGRNGDIVEVPIGKEYFYKLLPGMNKPKIGDLMVVSSNAGFGVVKVTTVDAKSKLDGHAYCVGTVDPTMYITELQKEKKRKELKSILDKKSKELMDIAAWEMIADRSPEFKELLEQYKAVIQ